MGRNLTGAAAMAVAAAAACNNPALNAHAFVPSVSSVASTFGGSSTTTRIGRSRNPVPQSGAAAPVMKVAGTQPQQQDAWQAGGVKTRELFNALSQGEIGKRAFTQALAKRMMNKATGMQRDFELSEAANLAASSSAIVESIGDLRYE